MLKGRLYPHQICGIMQGRKRRKTAYRLDCGTVYQGRSMKYLSAMHNAMAHAEEFREASQDAGFPDRFIHEPEAFPVVPDLLVIDGFP